ncbi:hypothetical protein CDD82_4354 [Ophiocordyceps australis]|uniref:FFD box profile domain-containing protein n=1 Tax=Ophiocordyceps australis TaxID=1399860 RepID=A0A2C5Z8C4_9HYPO|nr:hypothetical protein CDD82_4354 [Ophiocordyceps australis]
MSDILGSRISLISKSDIRYMGTLHEINSDESTVSLENVRSFGTEGRRGRPEEEIAPSDQVYEYIVFRGSDVKDLRIEEHPTSKENKPPPQMPDDPAIVGSRPRDAASNFAPHPPTGAFQHPYHPPHFYGGPPPPGSWGRGGGPGPIPGHGSTFGMPYPPPPGWFPPGQGFPPGGPGPWSSHPFPQGTTGPSAQDTQEPSQNQLPSAPPSEPQAVQTSATIGRSQGVAPEAKPTAKPARPVPNAPNLPLETKPSAEEVKAATTTLNTNGSTTKATEQPKSGLAASRNMKITPVVPLSGPTTKPFQLPTANKPEQVSVKATIAAAPTSVEDATNAARAAVAVAMAQLGNKSSNAMDNLTNKVNEMRVSAGRGVATGRGRGRGGRQNTQKFEVPDSDFDFAQSNAKFNKEDVAKEAIAGSPLSEQPSDPASKIIEYGMAERNPAIAYNKSKSFFDNISSEARERAQSSGQTLGGREWRGEEQRKNIETFGQGSVDGGYRNYRARGRGRGGRGRGFSRGSRGGPRP